mmetsp:Transcript_23166/g.39593  ORF Transcript_23166/g.39593 Transcript_23166/m.39593 type:complete len:145 (-) Transcript_23166:86-520(-)
MTLNSNEAVDDNEGDDFPWETVGKRSSVGLSKANKVAGIKVSTLMSFTKVAVCRKLEVTMGRVSEAIVFEKVDVTMGYIKDLHCLSTTTQDIGLGSIEKVHIHSQEELVKMALEKLDMNPPQPSPSAPLEPIHVNAVVVEDIKH